MGWGGFGLKNVMDLGGGFGLEECDGFGGSGVVDWGQDVPDEMDSMCWVWGGGCCGGGVFTGVRGCWAEAAVADAYAADLSEGWG
jgi:hypothetical protein